MCLDIFIFIYLFILQASTLIQVFQMLAKYLSKKHTKQLKSTKFKTYFNTFLQFKLGGQKHLYENLYSINIPMNKLLDKMEFFVRKNTYKDKNVHLQFFIQTESSSYIIKLISIISDGVTFN